MTPKMLIATNKITVDITFWASFVTIRIGTIQEKFLFKWPLPLGRWKKMSSLYIRANLIESYLNSDCEPWLNMTNRYGVRWMNIESTEQVHYVNNYYSELIFTFHFMWFCSNETLWNVTKLSSILTTMHEWQVILLFIVTELLNGAE